ncbi:TMV resistance protein N-like [Lotus japonicus]|uniref:TMV resistance protein N-like n=1 Tax=Lotus japonicus TaxID=34305 RepID=UPI00258D6416|nr:TMV resistance protein N-like [Lotus japonicus]
MGYPAHLIHDSVSLSNIHIDQPIPYHKEISNDTLCLLIRKLNMVYFFFFWSFLLVLFSFVTRLLLKRKGVALVSDNAPQTNWYDAVDTQQEEKYDVFVSFRGEDIRDGFLSHLAVAFHQKNIYTFVDERLQGGEEIWPSLVGAIEGSLISVIIFSENYASSTWCLKELIKILECRDKYGHTLILVFYGIDPTDVRHQTRSYESAFAEHRKKFDPTMVQIWRDALNKSANLSGIKSSDFG